MPITLSGPLLSLPTSPTFFFSSWYLRSPYVLFCIVLIILCRCSVLKYWISPTSESNPQFLLVHQTWVRTLVVFNWNHFVPANQPTRRDLMIILSRWTLHEVYIDEQSANYVLIICRASNQLLCLVRPMSFLTQINKHKIFQLVLVAFMFSQFIHKCRHLSIFCSFA